jgi:hypothetical protein
MKKLIMAVLTFTVIAAPFAMASNKEMIKYGSISAHEEKLISLCKAIKSNSRARLSMALRKDRIRYSEMQKGLVCNGQDPMTFAITHHAMDNAHAIASRTKLDITHIVAKN